ncbi:MULTISPECIES: PAS domain-containing sensor histidine kinase [unclassified Burkholderia]|uniref:PAS domain-containing sensor histidine kinase n=1 Tax=unclassified Burkholderia TaxID=2613784 RepID=UPI000F55F001|nr:MULTISPECIES: PAS domain-containing sensor histidine kinase [unclassified Burkholderia]RQR30147.1 PAS domain S-box protein [Burkholderia sp. Bp9142]RQR50029.1 PAS domain S-box protein [Burkholderia sp. Bp9140]
MNGRNHTQSEISESVPVQVSCDDIPFRVIVEQSLAGIYVILDERFMYANEAFASMFGYRPEEFVGTHLEDLATPDCREEVMRNYRLRLTGEQGSIRYFPKCVHRDGHVVYLDVHGSGVDYRGRRAIFGVGVDISDRVERENDLRSSREQLRQLTVSLDAVREEQRAALAREVHDVLGGMLTSIKMDVSRIIRRAVPAQSDDIVEIATELVALVQETIDAARRISDELRPSILDALGLTAAIRREARQFENRTGVDTTLVTDGIERQLSAERMTQCFRVVQEALTNVARHAEAGRVQIRLRWQVGSLLIEVADDGCGIDPASMREHSIGMLGMSERAGKIGGTLEVGRANACGTVVSLVLPIDDEKERTDD